MLTRLPSVTPSARKKAGQGFYTRIDKHIRLGVRESVLVGSVTLYEEFLLGQVS